MNAKSDIEVAVDLLKNKPLAILDVRYNPLRAEIMALLEKEATLSQAKALIAKIDSNIPKVFKLDILTVITSFGKTHPNLEDTLKEYLQATQFGRGEWQKAKT